MKQKIIFISESIRRDSHAPLKYFEEFEVLHFYLNAPYGDMTQKDLVGAKRVSLDNLLQEIVGAKPDFIQGAEPFGSRLSLRISAISLKAAGQTGAKLIIPILENRPIHERFNFIQRIVLRLFCPKYFKAAQAVVCMNKGAVKNVKHYYEKAAIKTGIIWGVWGVDLNLFKPVAKKINGRIVYVGRWVEEKGVKFLLEGFAKAKQKLDFISLDFVGSGSLEDYVKDFIIEQKLEDSINIVGYIKNEELPYYISRAQLDIYPSITVKRWEEQVGTVNFQALACGTALLTTRSGAIPEYIKEGRGAMLINEKSSEEIAEALIKFFSNEEFKNGLLADAREAAKEYDIKKEINKAQELLKKL